MRNSHNPRGIPLVILVAGVAIHGCAYLGPRPSLQLPTRESLRATVWTHEVIRLPREQQNARLLAKWVSTADPADQALGLTLLWAVGLQGAGPRGVREYVPGADTQARWNLDPGLAAAQLLAAPLSLRPPLQAALYPARDHLRESLQWQSGATETTARELQVVRADMHVHSAFSWDSAAPLREILLAAQRNRIDVLAITDHDTMTYPVVKATYDDMAAHGEIVRPIILIPGVEISSADGHILAYFVHQPIPPGMDSWSTVAAIHRQGGIAVLAHPHRPGSGISGPLAREVAFDGVERYNGAEIFYPLAWVADEADADAVSRRQFGSSDAHFSAWVGAAYTEMAVTAFSEQSVRDAIMANRLRPEPGNPVLRGWSRGFVQSPAGFAALAAVSPRLVQTRLRSWVADWLHMTGIDLETSWHQALIDAYSIWRYRDIVGQINDPRSVLHIPPLPVRSEIRFHRLVLSLETPVQNFAGKAETTAPILRKRKTIQDFPSLYIANGDNFFVWPTEIVAGLDWQYIF